MRCCGHFNCIADSSDSPRRIYACVRRRGESVNARMLGYTLHRAAGSYLYELKKERTEDDGLDQVNQRVLRDVRIAESRDAGLGSKPRIWPRSTHGCVLQPSPRRYIDKVKPAKRGSKANEPRTDWKKSLRPAYVHPKRVPPRLRVLLAHRCSNSRFSMPNPNNRSRTSAFGTASTIARFASPR